jgi:hypothetical protein
MHNYPLSVYLTSKSTREARDHSLAGIISTLRADWEGLFPLASNRSNGLRILSKHRLNGLSTAGAQVIEASMYTSEMKEDTERFLWSINPDSIIMARASLFMEDSDHGPVATLQFYLRSGHTSCVGSGPAVLVDEKIAYDDEGESRVASWIAKVQEDEKIPKREEKASAVGDDDALFTLQG